MDWDAAYDNGFGLPPDTPDYEALWPLEAALFRARLDGESRADIGIAYGPDALQRLDLFRPVGPPRGLAVFVHGGYWHLFDASAWSQFAAGAVERGFAVAVPSYRLCPEVRITDIVADVAAAVTKAAAGIDGPIHLSGHSAGGHLVSRLATTTSPLATEIRERLDKVVSISGLHDLHPLMRTSMNSILRIDNAEAARESPALLEPLPNVRLCAWVGARERPELIRQTDLLGAAWAGRVPTEIVHDRGRHHFDVIDGLRAAQHPLTLALTEGG